MAGGIEFLEPDPAPGQDEQLPGPRRHRDGPSRPVRVVVLVAVAALIVIGFVVRLAGSGSDSAAPPSASLAPSSQATPSTHLAPTTNSAPTPGVGSATPDGPAFDVRCGAIPVVVQVQDPGGGLIRKSTVAERPAPQATTITLDPTTGARVTPGPRRSTATSLCVPDPTGCPEADDGQSACTSTTQLPRGVLAAVLARYPGARVTAARSEIVRETHAIWFRGVSLRAGDQTITVVVEQPGVDPGPRGAADNGTDAVSRGVVTGSTYNVVVVVTSPSGSKPDTSLPQQLAGDPRLAATA